MLVEGGVSDPGSMVTVLWAEPPEARRRRRKFWAPKGPFPKKSSSAHQNTRGPKSRRRRALRRPIWPLGCCLQLPPAGPAASAGAATVPAALLPCIVLARPLCSCSTTGARRSSRCSPCVSPSCTVSRRVSAAFRRAAAAYGVVYLAFYSARDV